MKPLPLFQFVLLAVSAASRISAQESHAEPEAARLTSPIDFWGKGPPSPKRGPGTAASAEIGPGKILLRETLWAQPIRTPDGNWMLYVPPKPILDFLENPTEETAKAYLAWKKEQAAKLGRAMLLLGRLKESGAARPKADGLRGTRDLAPEEGSDLSATLLYFKKPSCPHCVSQDGVLAQWLPKHPGIRLGVVLPEERPELWKAYGVRGTPTLVLRSPTGREEVLVGRKSEAELDAALQRTGATSSEPLPSEGREPSQ
jgi:hypothetical protein